MSAWAIIVDDDNGTIVGSTSSRDDAEAILASDWFPGNVFKRADWPVIRPLMRVVELCFIPVPAVGREEE